jgi:hypothetical protein
MQGLRFTLLVPVPLGIGRGQELTANLISDSWIPPNLGSTPAAEWDPLDRYLTFIAQAYGETLSRAKLPPKDRTFAMDCQADPDDENLLRYSFRPQPRTITVRF